MASDFRAIIGSDGVDHGLDRQELLTGGVGNGLGCPMHDFLQQAEARASFNRREDCLVPLPANDGIGLQVADP